MNDGTAIAPDPRPLWRRIVDFPLVTMIIGAAAFLLAAGIAFFVAAKLVPPIESQNVKLLVSGAITLVLVLLTYKLLIARLGEHPRDDLRSGHALRDIAIGLALGIGIMAAAVGVAAIAGVYRIMGEGDTTRLIPELIGVAIMPAILEETLFRGILFRWLEEFAGSWAALVVTSALFGIGHIFNPNATWFSSFAIAVEAGILLGGAYMLTRSLWLPIGLHAGWNFTQGEIFDVPVSGIDEHGLVEAQLSGPAILSGGQFGLEASIIGLVIATAVGVWLVWRAVNRGQLVRPMWARAPVTRQDHHDRTIDEAPAA